MTRENDAGFGEEWSCGFKIDMRNLTNFNPRTQESQNFSL